MCCALWGKIFSTVKHTALGYAKNMLLVSQIPGIQTLRRFFCLQLSGAKKIKGPKRRGLAFFPWSMEPKVVFLLLFTQSTKCTMGLLKVCFLLAASGIMETQFFQTEPIARRGQGCLYRRTVCFYLDLAVWEPQRWQDAGPRCEVCVENNFKVSSWSHKALC